MKIKIDYKSFIQRGITPVNDDFYVRLITGYQGSGKSYIGVKLVEEEPKDRLIKTNIKSYHNPLKNIIYFEKIEDIWDDEDDGVTYLIDELSKKYTKDSRQDLKFYSWLQQSRKHKRHVLLITQEYIQVPTWLRGIATTIYSTSKVPLLPIYKTTLGVPVLNDTYEWELSPQYMWIYKRTKNICDKYNTFEPISTL